MSMILHVDAWKLGIIFFILMLVAGSVGLWVASRQVPGDGGQNTRIADASIALFALLLAFSFSGAAERFEGRKSFRLNEAVAIGDFATTASMLEDPENREIRLLLIDYVKERLQFGSVRIDGPQMEGVTARSRAIQQQIQQILHDIVARKQAATLHTPLMNGFNGLTMTHDHALYGSRNQVSDTIIVLLVFFGVVSAFMIAFTASQPARRGPLMTWMIVYTLLVSAVFTVTMDLEQPHRGIITSSKAPLIDLLASLQQQGQPG